MFLKSAIKTWFRSFLWLIAFSCGASPAFSQANDWAYFWQEGTPGTRGVYMFKMDAAVAQYTPSGTALLARAGNTGLTRELAEQLRGEQFQVMRIAFVSEKPGAPKLTEMVVHFDCGRKKIRLAQTTNRYTDRSDETRTSNEWFPVPFSWAYRAGGLACEQKPWRDAWNATAKHWICVRYPAPRRGSISRECSDAITRTNAGYVCDKARMERAGIICLRVGETAEDARRFAADKLIPVFNGVPLPQSERPTSEPFIGVMPKLPEDP
jgi:hypothetical protein